ncbi:hypothetical protein [Kosakonia sp. R1.Fl]|uniref:hypothetical protein n=1 Tax=Kosakonia sp. R1.Fl TaxID=2928706 RepID=UPI00201DEA7F|nr:hypothetical protein [Kosakonia sp. R1.Fl]MCL6745417.1 hypothetical protein [Kosakonia sp. R1.Fl]
MLISEDRTMIIIKTANPPNSLAATGRFFIDGNSFVIEVSSILILNIQKTVSFSLLIRLQVSSLLKRTLEIGLIKLLIDNCCALFNEKKKKLKMKNIFYVNEAHCIMDITKAGRFYSITVVIMSQQRFYWQR